MTINFTQIFQQSWNFIRNHRQVITVFVVALFTLSLTMQAISAYLMPFVLADIEKLPANPNFPKEVSTMFAVMTDSRLLMLSVASQVVSYFISTWAIVSFHHIAHQKTFTLLQTCLYALRYFLAVLALNVMILLPLVYGVIVSLQSGMGFVLIIVGIYLFIRLCLVSFVCVLEQKTFLQSIQFTWRSAEKRMSILLMYCLIAILFVSFLTNQLLMVDNLVLQFVTTLASAFINVFTLVFSYRFYQLFIHQK